MHVVGLMIVRNEADILRVNVLHHLSLGVDRFLIVDNGSSDGTNRILRELSGDGRVKWREDPGPYRQSEITTDLAREAFRTGADWVIPIDADEFWCAPGGDFRGVLEHSTGGGLQVEVLNFIQRRDQLEATPEGLLAMTRRTPLPVGPLERVRQLVEARQYAYVEMMYSPKFISRPTASIQIAMGNHGVTDLPGPVEVTEKIVCFHAALRSRSVLQAKVEQGNRVAELGLGPEQGWHVRRWTRLAAEGRLEDEWRANSFADDCLDAYGVSHHVVFDPRLRDLAARWVRQPEPCRSRPSESHENERPALLHTIQEEINSHHQMSRILAETLQIGVDERDRVIRSLHAELQTKVGERDQLIGQLQTEVADQDQAIGDLQVELHDKVQECNRIISDLEEELQAKVAQRDCTITELQSQLVQQVSARDRTITALQSELHQKVDERDRNIAELQAELRDKVGDRDRTITALQSELHQKVDERDRNIAEFRAELHRKVEERVQLTGRENQYKQTIQDLREALDTIQRSRLWPLIRLLLGNRPGKKHQ